MDDKLKWYGYLSTNGTLHTKRLLAADDMEQAIESDLVSRVYGPVEESSRLLATVALRKLHDAATHTPTPQARSEADNKLEAVKRAVKDLVSTVGVEAAEVELDKFLTFMLGDFHDRKLGETTIVKTKADRYF